MEFGVCRTGNDLCFRNGCDAGMGNPEFCENAIFPCYWGFSTGRKKISGRMESSRRFKIFSITGIIQRKWF